jgi:hypothetical protein
MSGSASYSGGGTTSTNTVTNTTSYNYNPVAASGGQNFIDTGSGKLSVSEGLNATEIQSLAGLGSVFMSHFGTGGISAGNYPSGSSSGSGTIIQPVSSGSYGLSGSGGITGILTNPYVLVAGAGILAVAIFLMYGRK